MNITDVDDKTIRDSQKEGLSLKEFTEKYTKAFLDDIKALNISMPDIMPKATEHVNEMVDLIKVLLKKEIAYKSEDGIYFSVHKYPEYGKLANIKLDEAQRGHRCSSDEYDKEKAHDFALWKFWDEKDGNVFWETEIGKGRPGWHIECSAMSMKYLGESFDIHTGGVDLIFPHHENEIAQSEAVTSKPFVKYWIHNEYILVDGKKMSKSLGNFYTLRDLLDKGYSPVGIRYLLLSAHYRQQFNFTIEGIKAAEQAVKRLREFVDSLKKADGEENEQVKELIKQAKEGFENAMDDDLNMSQALSSIFEFIKAVYKLKISKKDAKIILEFMNSIDSVLGVIGHDDENIPKEVLELAEKRQKARADKNWAEADKLRDLIAEKGYEIKDTKKGFVVKKQEL